MRPTVLLALLISVLAAILSFSEAHDSNNGVPDEHGVLDIDPQTFMHFTSKKTWLVMFYGPLCAHCTRLDPTWNKLPALLSKYPELQKIKVGRFDTSKPGAQDLVVRLKANPWPSVKLIVTGIVYTHPDARGVEKPSDIRRFLVGGEEGERAEQIRHPFSHLTPEGTLASLLTSSQHIHQEGRLKINKNGGEQEMITVRDAHGNEIKIPADTKPVDVKTTTIIKRTKVKKKKKDERGVAHPEL
jgi:hypothetical protein